MKENITNVPFPIGTLFRGHVTENIYILTQYVYSSAKEIMGMYLHCVTEPNYSGRYPCFINSYCKIIEGKR